MPSIVTVTESEVPSVPVSALAVLGRVLIAAIFLLSGFAKITSPGVYLAMIGAAGLPLPIVGLVGSVIVELGGGILLVLGYRTRLVALVLALFSLATAVLIHHPFSDQNQFIHFFKNLAMAGGLLQVVAFGPGRFALSR